MSNTKDKIFILRLVVVIDGQQVKILVKKPLEQNSLKHQQVLYLLILVLHHHLKNKTTSV